MQLFIYISILIKPVTKPVGWLGYISYRILWSES